MPSARVAIGERVTLQTAEREDVPFLARQNTPELRRPTGNPVFSQTDLERQFEGGGFGDDTPLIVCLRDEESDPDSRDADTPRRIGLTVIEDHGRSRPELIYWLLPEHHGLGYGTEAVALAIDVAFQQHHHPAVEAKVFPGNEASRGLLESLGFTQEGRMRNTVYWDGQYRDQVLYGLLREEWHHSD